LALALWLVALWIDFGWIWYLLIPAKFAVVLASFCFLSDLSAFLARRPRRAVCLALALIGGSLGGMLLYLPWRNDFARAFSGGTYLWYYPGMEEDGLSLQWDFPNWLASWSSHVPHLIEAGLVSLFYGMWIGGCALGRLRRGHGAVLALAGYILLFAVPVITGLIAWDYDVFLMGIAMDSISFDLMPLSLWATGAHSIFLFAFSFLFFAITALAYRITPGSADQYSP
jgi:hypothetical protein